MELLGPVQKCMHDTKEQRECEPIDVKTTLSKSQTARPTHDHNTHVFFFSVGTELARLSVRKDCLYVKIPHPPPLPSHSPTRLLSLGHLCDKAIMGQNLPPCRKRASCTQLHSRTPLANAPAWAKRRTATSHTIACIDGSTLPETVPAVQVHHQVKPGLNLALARYVRVIAPRLDRGQRHPGSQHRSTKLSRLQGIGASQNLSWQMAVTNLVNCSRMHA